MLQGLLKGKPKVDFLVDIVAIEAQSAMKKWPIINIQYKVSQQILDGNLKKISNSRNYLEF